MLSNSDQNFDLTEEEFEHMKAELKLGNNLLFKKIFLSQVDESIRFLENSFRADYNDAYDSVLETLIQFRHRIISDKVYYGNLRFLFTSMASQFYQRSKGKEVEKLEISGIDLSDDEDQGHTYSDAQIMTLKLAWKKLSDSCSELLRMNYYLGLNLLDIAEKKGKSHNSIRKQKQRCKEQLKKLYMDNLIIE